MRETKRQTIKTSHGKIAVESAGHGFPVVFIHGNSACRQVFARQFASPLLANYRLIAFDLPGHGESDNATDADHTYTRPGLADLAVELLGEMRIEKAAIVGASLGGHVAIEMLARSAIPTGLFLMGTPPVGTNIAAGFRMRPMDGLGFQRDLDPKQMERFATAVFGVRHEQFMRSAIERTDPQFRVTLLAGLVRGLGINQRDALATIPVPTAIVNGADDQIIDLDYIDTITVANLWRGGCFRIPDIAHSPYWEAPELVNSLLSDFLLDTVSIEP